MAEIKNGIKVKTEFNMGGIAWTVIQKGDNWVMCIASENIGYSAFDWQDKNNFAISDLCTYLNGVFLEKLIKEGVPEEMFHLFEVDLTTDDGLNDYGIDDVKIGLITCDEYRILRDNIPHINKWWWTATPDSTINKRVRVVYMDGTLGYYNVSSGHGGVRPVCVLDTEKLTSYLDEITKERRLAVNITKRIVDQWHISTDEIFERK